jgi:hypothetical protein
VFHEDKNSCLFLGLGVLGAMPSVGNAEEVHQHPSQKEMQAVGKCSTGCCSCPCRKQMMDKSSMHEHFMKGQEGSSHGSSTPMDSMGKCNKN